MFLNVKYLWLTPKGPACQCQMWKLPALPTDSFWENVFKGTEREFGGGYKQRAKDVLF